MIAEKLKIFPLLILVALMAFSVRLVEVASGVSALTSGTAFAEDAPAQHPDESMLEKPAGDHAEEATPEKGHEGEDKVAEAEAGHEPAKPAMSAKKGEEIIWKDAADSDVDAAQAVKAEMFEDLTKRREMLDGREKDLTTREALLKAAEQELDRKYQELETIRTEIKDLLVEQSEEEKARIKSLVKIYEGMKPKDAAGIFDTLDLDVLVDVMTQMSERKLSPILAAMDPERARTVTIIMAEQKKLPELPDSN
ncbi:MAG: flagellar protein FlbB [Alphaproteobacteria bacterium]|nr:flagellar protein FlbB [Alphaproteobacteria bacterium]MCD8570269.1 flagellar protein FlbB [Alphaproteobacteria bacterium]